MIFSKFESRFSTTAEEVDVSFDELEQFFVPKVTQCTTENCQSRNGGKCQYRDVGVWSASRFNGKRAKENAHEITCLVYDVDGVTPGDASTFVQKIEAHGLSAFLMTTHSDTPELRCLRVILPTDRAMTPSEWTQMHPRIAQMLAINYDPQTRTDTARIFYMPSHPQGGTFRCDYMQGDVVKVEVVTETTVGDITIPEPTSNDVEAFRQKIRNGLKDDLKAIYNRASEGKALAEQGNRDQTLFMFFSAVARLSPETTWETVLFFFQTSLNAMGKDEHGRPWSEIAKDKWKRGREDYVAYLKEREEEKAQECNRVAERVRGKGKGVYTKEEMIAWSKEFGMGGTLQDFLEQQVIQYQSSFYFFVDGAYVGPTPHASFQRLAQDYLPLSGSEIYDYSKNGAKIKSIEELVRLYGRPANELVASLSIQKSTYKPGNPSVFTEAVAPIKVQPKRHEHVMEWLKLFGNGSPTFLNWIAAASKLDRQCCALYLMGDKGVGKSVLAHGLSRLWSTQPTEMKGIVGNWNAQLARCPLAFADEEAPKVDNIMVLVRELTGRPAFSLYRKFLPEASVLGNIRLIFAANNWNLLSTKEELSVRDADAVAERFLVIEPAPEAGEYIQRLQVTDEDLHIGLTKGMHIAETSLWLAQNYEYQRGKRFEVDGDSERLQRQLIMGSGTNSTILEFLCKYLSQEQIPPHEKYIRVGNGELLINATLVSDKTNWETHVPSTKIPTAARIGATLKNLSRGEKVVNGVRYFSLVTELVINFAKTSQVGNYDTVEQHITRK